MSKKHSQIAAVLRRDFDEEASTGFQRLGRVPQTLVVQFLDYFAALSASDRSALLDALAARGSIAFNLSPGVSYPYFQAFDRYWDAVHSQGSFTGGCRYTDVKFLASIPRIPEFGSYEGWVEKFQKPWVSQLALTPREDLLPDINCLKPAKPALLRKLVRAVLSDHGFTAQVIKGAEHKYVSTAGDIVRVDFGSRMGQICYRVSAVRGDTRMVMLSYEALWSQPGCWNYLTEENAACTIGLLPELAEYLVRLTERITA